MTLEVESIERRYLNLYVPRLQDPQGVVGFFRNRGLQLASGAVMAPVTNAFVDAIKTFLAGGGVDLVRFEPGQRKDDVAKEYLARFDGDVEPISGQRRRPAPRSACVRHA